MTAPPLLQRLLDRLYVSLANGPTLNCRPHSSRQRLDLAELCKWAVVRPEAVLADLLGPTGEAVLAPPAGESPADRWEREEALGGVLTRLRHVFEDSRSYEQDTGANALFVGFPMLSLRLGPKRIFAPVCFVPVDITQRHSPSPRVTLACRGDGADRVLPNEALLAWLEEVTGQPVHLGELPEDVPTWEEIRLVVAAVAGALELVAPELGSAVPLIPAPRAEDEVAGILPVAVLGLYPVTHQGLLTDLKALGENPPSDGPAARFLRADVVPPALVPPPYDPANERLVARADPCQARAVRLARGATALVVHGPPGTGKSQTITNIIGDHLVRGQRVLFVCEKRAALDVVHHRLDRLGLGELCAVVHDARRDQRDLYRAVRDQLDALAERQPPGGATPDRPPATRLDALDAELAALYRELRAGYDAVDGGPESLHALVGEWMLMSVSPVLARDPALQEVALPIEEVRQREREVREALDRAEAAALPEHEWFTATQLRLQDLRAEPAQRWQERLSAAIRLAEALDAVPAPESLPFRAPADGPLGNPEPEAEQRVKALHYVETALAALPADTIASWAAHADEALLRAAAEAVGALGADLDTAERTPPAPDLALIARDRLQLPEVVRWHAALQAWTRVASRWWGIFCFGRRRAARLVLERFAVPLESADRVLSFLGLERSARVLVDVLSRVFRDPREFTGPREAAAAVRGYEALVQAVQCAVPGLRAALADVERHAELVTELRESPGRAAAIRTAEEGLASPLFTPAFLRDLGVAMRRGVAVAPRLRALLDHVGSLEATVRVQEAILSLPAGLQPLVARMASLGASAPEGFVALLKGALRHAVTKRLGEQPLLGQLDDTWYRSRFDRWNRLADQRHDAVRDVVLTQWLARQKQRLLAGTQSRLGPQGAELRRRLVLRGERALRLRQVIALGQDQRSADGDPLFDLRPVWMASPETVAQVFPRAALFDVVIFDEASQCRLEHALPVLARATRVVIAGDPKQLPPTRFFEAVVTKGDALPVELDDQTLFERQQADVDDLLGAALNLELDAAHLDVHYRSRDAALIAFSNRWFYEGRLQVVPPPPGPTAPPVIHVRHVAGAVYEKGVNPAEAQAVVEAVRELLSRAEPPSVGVACMNRAQADAINDALEAAAEQDPAFAENLERARQRRGRASSEGLVVKNLENVQGDERDHLVISTTYGPDAKGRFYKRFGPLAAPGGGRRLNVLATRAREAIHVVTSIPRNEYAALPEVPTGEQPNGAYLLLQYLSWAEDQGRSTTSSNNQPTRDPIARALAALLPGPSNGGPSSEGFTIDLVTGAPPVGVVLDGPRYARANDPVEWDQFRMRVLMESGWRLLRVAAPELAYDSAAVLRRLAHR